MHWETSQICGVDRIRFLISKPVMKKAGVSAGLSVLLESLNALDIQLPSVENKANRTSIPINAYYLNLQART